MYISHSWLKKYLPELDRLEPQTISNALTGVLAEVEKYFFVRDGLEKIVCGEVLEVKPIEGTSKLSQCVVDIGPSKETIICGAPNVKAGQKVAVCLPGGRVYDAHSKNPNDTMVIKEKALMGVNSHGMICSPKELNISDDHEGIIVLEPELKIGTDLVPVLKDTVYEIENESLSHRPDCFSHIGIARELSAILNLEFVENTPEPILAFTKKIPFDLEVKVDEKLCPRFTTVLLTDVEVKQSPLWLLSKLTAVDVRPVNNIVDITNYVMMDKGQPLHAYDYGKLAGNKLVVRHAKENEQFEALNGKQYKLTKDNLVVTDGAEIQDLAGVMGGVNSEVSPDTKTIVLEAANFNMYNIRRTSRLLGVRSEASTRFEKGQDPNNCIIGLKTSLELLLDLSNSEIVSELQDHYPNKYETKLIRFNILSIKRFLGIDLSRQEIIDTFKRLRLGVSEQEKAQDELEISIPTFRGDLNIEADLLEEIARLYGYTKIQPTLPNRAITATNINIFSRISRRINSALIKTGFDEVLTYSFIDPNVYAKLGISTKDCLSIANPLSPELSLVRNSLIPSLVEVTKNNAKNLDQFKIFEIGRAISSGLDADGIHNQPWKLGMLIYSEDAKNCFFDLHGELKLLMSELGINFTVSPNPKSEVLQPIIHKYRAAQIKTDSQNLGLIAEIAPSMLDKIGLKGRVAFLEIDLEEVSKLVKHTKSYTKLSIYPPVFRDLSFWLDKKITYLQFIQNILGLNNQLIRDIELIDQFKNPEKANQKSITIRVKLQDDKKTLKDSEIDPIIKEITGILEKNLKAVLRSSK